jgi:hypothetical protein
MREAIASLRGHEAHRRAEQVFARAETGAISTTHPPTRVTGALHGVKPLARVIQESRFHDD